MKKFIAALLLIACAGIGKAQKDSLTSPGDILAAFHRVEVSMNGARANIDEKNKATLEALKQKSRENSDFTYFNKATMVDEAATEFTAYVDSLKQQVAGVTGTEPGNIEASADLFIKQGKGKELRERIDKTRVAMLALLPREEQEKIKSDLVAEDNTRTGQTWESELFEHSPRAAVVTLLDKIKNDAKNTEAQVLQQIENAADGNCTVTNAVIVPKSNFVLSGSKFEADIHMATSDTCKPFYAIINGQSIKARNGVVKYEAVSGGEGQQEVSGYIEYAGGQLPFETSYTVYKGAATISADKMNMLYIGLDNPISVSVPGFTPDKIVVTMIGGDTLIKNNNSYYNSYIARVNTRGEVTINVAVKMDGDYTRSMGSAKFRVRNVPTPVAQLGTILNGSTANKDIIANATKLYSSGGEGFAFEGLKYTVLKYTLTLASDKNESVNVEGELVTEAAKVLINKAKSGDKIIIDNITVSDPDGERKASPFVVTVR